MKPWAEFCVRGARTLLWAVSSFVLWTLWLGLVLLIVFQLYIITANELAIPEFVLRQVEARLAESGLRATFSRTSFDPAGRVLIENLRLSVPPFAEPVVTVRSVFVRINPWPLIVGRIEPREIRIHELDAAVPAMLSQSGQPEEIVRGLDASLLPLRRSLEIEQLSARIAGVPVSAHGTLNFAPTAAAKPGAELLAEFLSKRFPTLCQQALQIKEQLTHFDEPALQLEITPSESGAPTIQVLALARGLQLTQPVNVELVNVTASTRVLLFGDVPPSDVRVVADVVRVPGQVTATGVQARVLGRIRIDGSQFDLREVALTVDSLSTAGVDARAIAAQIYPRTLPRLETNAIATVLASPLTLHAEADLRQKLGRVRFDGTISPQVLDAVSRQVGVDVKKYLDFETLTAERGEARFGANWKFEKLEVRVRIPKLHAYGVVMDGGRATIELDPHRLYSPDAFARVGVNFARGSYEQNLQTKQYRFLLDGRLQPLDISPWFREWWPNFFQQLEFRQGGPDASVDVRGAWGDGNQSNIFVFADVIRPIIRGTPLDRVRARLFIRPGFFDGLEVLATQGEGHAFGRFTYISDPDTHAWHTLELGLDSTLDLKVATQLLGPLGAKTLGAFSLATAPTVKFRGQFAGPEAPGGASEKLRIEARTSGEFRFHDFPLNDVSFVATIDRDEVVLDDVAAQFAGGVAGGHARVWGAGEQRRLGFDLSLSDANLGQLASGVAEYFAAQKGAAPTPPGKFVQDKANVRINVAASAEGRYTDPFSYHGEGNAVLQGAEIGEVPLLGTLSDLLKFTALRFTEARANFKVDGAKLLFPAISLRGANSAIDAHGTYVLDRRELDFNAKIFPFQESESLLKSVVGAVLAPLSSAFEVKLSGSLAKPQWVFVRGPTNLLRSLAPSAENAAKAEDATAGKNGKPAVPVEENAKASSAATPKP